MSSSSKSIAWLHFPLFGIGIYNSYKFIGYYIEVWGSLHQQGIGHAYLIVTGVFGSWWNMVGLVLCFSANAMLQNCEGKSLARGITSVGIGIVASLVLPALLQTGYFMVIVWLHSLLFR